MDKQYISDNEIDIKYLRNKLTPEETEAFEIYLMDHPELLDHLELDQALVSHMPEVGFEKEARRAFNLLPWFRYGALTCFSFVAGLVVSTGSFTGSASNTGHNVEIGYLVQTRSIESDDLTRVFNVSPNDNIVIVLEGLMPQKKSYRLLINEVENGDKKRVVKQIESVVPTETGEVSLVFNANELGAGVFSARVLSENGSSTKDIEYLFRIVLSGDNLKN